MSRNHVSTSVPAFGRFVNLAVSLVAIAVIGAGYFSAIGSFAGVA